VSATGRKTYWHLAHLGRNPTDYDIASSRLHYWTERGFEVKMPLGDWYERFQKGSELRCSDWEQWSDPRQTTYTTYTSLQHARETYIDGLLDSISEDYDSRLPQEWLAVLDRIIPPLLYPVHGLQMVSAYVGQMAPSGRITIAAAFQTADEIRRIQRLAYRIRQLQITYPEFGRNARQAWQADPLWQPLREVIERLLVTWDWGEACVALQVAVKPAFDALFMTYVGIWWLRPPATMCSNGSFSPSTRIAHGIERGATRCCSLRFATTRNRQRRSSVGSTIGPHRSGMLSVRSVRCSRRYRSECPQICRPRSTNTISPNCALKVDCAFLLASWLP
jgi:hypothetical protein